MGSEIPLNPGRVGQCWRSSGACGRAGGTARAQGNGRVSACTQPAGMQQHCADQTLWAPEGQLCSLPVGGSEVMLFGLHAAQLQLNWVVLHRDVGTLRVVPCVMGTYIRSLHIIQQTAGACASENFCGLYHAWTTPCNQELAYMLGLGCTNRR